MGIRRWRCVCAGLRIGSGETVLSVAKRKDAVSAGAVITGVQAIPPADSRSDEVAQRDTPGHQAR